MIEPDDFKGYEPPRSNWAFLAVLLALIGSISGILWLLAVLYGVL